RNDAEAQKGEEFSDFSALFCGLASSRLLGKFPLQVLEIVEGGTSLPRVPISKKLPPCERGGAPPLRGFALNSGSPVNRRWAAHFQRRSVENLPIWLNDLERAGPG